jgi:four helix bundle protein
MNQTRRAAASIPTNVAEGCGRNSDAELARFCKIALGSANELDYQLLLGKDLGYLPAPQYLQLTSETRQIRRMLTALIHRVSRIDS